eukprot:338901-Pelagomonas_calceolata.AAC.2
MTTLGAVVCGLVVCTCVQAMVKSLRIYSCNGKCERWILVVCASVQAMYESLRISMGSQQHLQQEQESSQQHQPHRQRHARQERQRTDRSASPAGRHAFPSRCVVGVQRYTGFVSKEQQRVECSTSPCVLYLQQGHTLLISGCLALPAVKAFKGLPPAPWCCWRGNSFFFSLVPMTFSRAPACSPPLPYNKSPLCEACKHHTTLNALFTMITDIAFSQ